MVFLNIKNILNDLGESQYWLSKQTGIDRKNIRNMCNGNAERIQLDTIDKLCNALNCEVSDIIIRESDVK